MQNQNHERNKLLFELESFIHQKKDSSVHQKLSHTLEHGNKLFDACHFVSKDNCLSPRAIISKNRFQIPGGYYVLFSGFSFLK
jgi:hypothetical protein